MYLRCCSETFFLYITNKTLFTYFVDTFHNQHNTNKGAFAFGLVGGGIWNFVGGWRNAPKNQGMAQALARMQARTPVLGTYSCFVRLLVV